MEDSHVGSTTLWLRPRKLLESLDQIVMADAADSRAGAMTDDDWKYAWVDWRYLWNVESMNHFAKGSVYDVTLRKATLGGTLGILVSVSEEEECLLVEDILPGGAVGSFNLLCAQNPVNDGAKTIIRAGDKIYSVNEVWKRARAMVRECVIQETCRLTIVRGASSPLRAEAGAFVPMASSHMLSVPTATFPSIPEIKDIHFL